MTRTDFIFLMVFSLSGAVSYAAERTSPAAVESVCEAVLAGYQQEPVSVKNGSTDESRAVLETFLQLNKDKLNALLAENGFVLPSLQNIVNTDPKVLAKAERQNVWTRKSKSKAT